jgi:hypothetical protein
MDGGADKIWLAGYAGDFWFGGNFSIGFTPLLFSFYLHIKGTIRCQVAWLFYFESVGWV